MEVIDEFKPKPSSWNTKDYIQKIAIDYWAPFGKKVKCKYDANVIETIYKEHLLDEDKLKKSLPILEFSQYFEAYLWPNFDPKTATPSHYMSIILVLNQKFDEGVYAWNKIEESQEHFPEFFHQILKYSLCKVEKSLNEKNGRNYNASIEEQREILKFLTHTLEKDFIRKEVQDIVSLLTWSCLNELVDRLSFYMSFEINNMTGKSLSRVEVVQGLYERIKFLQKATFKNYSELKSFSLSTVSAVCSRKNLLRYFQDVKVDVLHDITAYLSLIPISQESDEEKHSQPYTKEFLLELIVSSFEEKQSQIEKLNNLPFYPTEEVLWDENLVPNQFYSGKECFSLPKLNLQFLTIHDYLLRNFILFQLESTYEIRENIENALARLKPWQSPQGGIMFDGWSRYALPLQDFHVTEIGQPNIGNTKPSLVKAEFTVVLDMKDEHRIEWQTIRKHDVLLFLSLKSRTSEIDTPSNAEIFRVRGAEVDAMLDEDNNPIDEFSEKKPEFTSNSRSWRIILDSSQYHTDTLEENLDIYSSFNVVLRRNPKENNFKAVLETILQLMNTQCVIPDWLEDILLGYGDPNSAHYTNMTGQTTHKLNILDFRDTFINESHLSQSFPGFTLNVEKAKSSKNKCDNDDDDDDDYQRFFYRIVFPENEKGENKQLHAQAYIDNVKSPYVQRQHKVNKIPFTRTQIEAIKSGMQPGLTMVIGPPGSGKTDVAVQIISNLYHNFPEQRTLIVTHSNQALNQIFEKITLLNIDERHLLRLGHGEEELETEQDFSRYGRVNFVLRKRLYLLEEVRRLASSLVMNTLRSSVETGDDQASGQKSDSSFLTRMHDEFKEYAFSCETAIYFYLSKVLPAWNKFLADVKTNSNEGEYLTNVASIAQLFPFTKFFENAPQPLFKESSFEKNFEIAHTCFHYINNIFTQLEEFRAFEFIRGGSDRSKYLLTREAKIIAMTCTHAALKRKDLVDISFRYDNILIEEAAQILEIETFIPLLLQNPENGHNRLKRWIMIGDNNQLPPVIKNMALQKFSNMEQSLFTRFVRLGIPTINLDAQGRARPSLCNLYKWKYSKLENMPHILNDREYRISNPGFCYELQVIDVQDFNGVGETQPNPFFYQNLAEAEYAVAIFMYMRLIGYPTSKITLLSTYNGQKHLIRDILRKRCLNNPTFGWPSKVTTVDRYQGQQNDYVILSLVRTKSHGHLRDVRRLIVAMSRARLGLYILSRVSLFSNCCELIPVFDQTDFNEYKTRFAKRPLNLQGPNLKMLVRNPTQLYLLPMERYGPFFDRPYERLPVSISPLVIPDMPSMANFVFEMSDKVGLLQPRNNFEENNEMNQTS